MDVWRHVDPPNPPATARNRVHDEVMKNVQIDSMGQLHCWNCGAMAFNQKRTARSKVMFGVGALATKKKLKCQSCGEYNDVGNADPFEGGKLAKKAQREQEVEEFWAERKAQKKLEKAERDAEQAVGETEAFARGEWAKIAARDLRPGDEVKQMGMKSVVQEVGPGYRSGAVRIVTDSWTVKNMDGEAKYKARRPAEN